MLRRGESSLSRQLAEERGRWCLCCRQLANCVNPLHLCPDPVWPLKYFTILLITMMFWGALYTIFKDDFLPDKSLFHLISLAVCGYIAGMLVSVVRLPPLFGMLLMGILMENIGFLHFSAPFIQAIPVIRSISLVVILIKAGMGLDATVLRKLSTLVFKMALIPCVAEAFGVCIGAFFILGLPLQWGLLLGFVLGAVSPAIVVPSLLLLQEQGFGEEKGIPTLVIAALSLDDIIAISGFGIVLGTIFSTGSLVKKILHGPEEILIGLTFGIFWGFLTWYFPHKDDPGVIFCRSALLGIGSVFAVMGSQIVGFAGAGPLACLIASFVANCGWKMLGWPSYNPVRKVFDVIWQICQPLLFGLIGAEIKFSFISGNSVQNAFAVIFCGLLVRIPTTFLVSWQASFTIREKFFLCICWIPKATVQAAIGPVALDVAYQTHADETVISYGQMILTVAVLSILLTAPLGAVAIYLTGPCLLTRTEDLNF